MFLLPLVTILKNSSCTSLSFPWLRHVVARLPALIPSSCAVCGLRATQVLCEPCRQQFFHSAAIRCASCALPLAYAGEGIIAPRCGACLKHPPAYDATVVVAAYQAPIDQLVLGLKFGGKLAFAPLFAGLLRDSLLAGRNAKDVETSFPACLIPVPLSPQRLQQRGFNQSLEIAKPLARHLGLPVLARSLERIRDTQSQASLPISDRHKNLRDAFIVRADSVAQIRGRHVGLVDDVMTTGETLQELATTLKRFGAARVTNLVFARTLPR